MLSIDTNILVYALNQAASEHVAARAFLEAHSDNDQLAICELVLMETYVLLRNPVVFPRPCSASLAASQVQAFRLHPKWRLVDYPGTSSGLMDQLWIRMGHGDIARGRIFDVRLALTLRHHGVEHFATANPKHFSGFGFSKVFNPISVGE